MRRLETGDQLGRYKILKRLGAGAMGEVYLAEDPQIGRHVALKTVLVQEGRAKEVEERKLRLLREARAAGKLLHPNVVALFDAGEDQGILYLAFEFVEGTDLADRVAAGPTLTLGETLAILRQAAEGLDYAHRQGVVHRDIKPSNLMLTADGRVKIADFGIARVADQTSDLTMTGSVVGSPHYMSPEQIRGDELDGRTDIFSLGVLLYEILCQRRPFEGETLTTLVYQILNQEPTPLPVRRPDLGPRMEQLVRRMLHKDRDQRFASAGELAREIASCQTELSPALLAGAALPPETPTGATVLMREETPTAARPAMAPSPPSPPTPPRAPVVAAAAAPKSRLGLVAVIVVVVLGVLVGAGFAARQFVAGLKAKAQTEAPAPDSPTAPATTTPATDERGRVVQIADARPLDQPAAPEPSATPAAAAVAQLEPGTRAAVPVETAPARPDPVERPVPTRPAPEPRRVEPEPAPVHREEPPAAEPEPAPVQREEPPDPRAERAALIESVPVNREMTTGMNLSFDVQPKDVAEQVIVKLDRIVIGRAAEWNAKKRDGRAYAVPDAGPHILTFLLDGNPVYRIRIDAQPGGAAPTTVAVSLGPPGRRRR